MLIGVTGGIGCGKSVVAKELCELLGAPGYSSDEICRELLLKGQPGYLEFIELFDSRFLDESGAIDRRKVRERVFGDGRSRKKLEKILHPLVRQRIHAEHEQVGDEVPVIAEVPLLFESGWEHDFDGIVCVIAPLDLVVQRIIARDQVTREDARAIISAQMSIEEKAARSDWVIENNGNYGHVFQQTAEVADLINKRCKKG